jgi:hypothetical protein
VLGAERFAAACFATVADPLLRSLPPLGGIDQFADSTEAATPAAARAVRAFYRQIIGSPA